MSRYTYDEVSVSSALLALCGATVKDGKVDGNIGTGGVCSAIEETGSQIQKAIKNIENARGASLIDSLTSNKAYLNSLSSTSIEAIKEQCQIIALICEQIHAYETAGFFTKLFATIGLSGSKLFEGIFGVGEGLVDGLASVVAWAGSGLGADMSGLQDFIKFDAFGTLGHNFREATGANKYSIWSENGTAANLIEGFGTMLGYTALGVASGGLAGDLVTGYIADLGMTTQANMNAGASFEDAFSAGTKEAVKGAFFTAVLGSLAKAPATVGKEALGTVDDIGVKGLGTVDDLDDSVKNMQKSITGLDSTTGTLKKIDNTNLPKGANVKNTTIDAIPGKNVDIDTVKSYPKNGTDIKKYVVTDTAEPTKKLAEIDVVTKKDGSMVKTTTKIDPDSGKLTTKTIEKADASGKTTSIETTKYESGHKRTVEKITETKDGSFTKVTKEGHTTKTASTTTTEKITVTKDTSGATTGIKTETFDGKLKRDGTPKKHTTKVSDTTETISSGDVQTRVSNTYDETGKKVVSTTTDTISSSEIQRKVDINGVTTKEATLKVDIDGDNIKKVDMVEKKLDTNGDIESLKRTINEYDDARITKQTVNEYEYESGTATIKNQSSTVDEVTVSSKNAKINTETIQRKTTVNGVTDEITYTRDVSAKSGKVVDVTSTKVTTDATTGIKKTIEESANGTGTINKRVTSSVDASGAKTGTELTETVNRQGYKRNTSIEYSNGDPTGKPKVTVEIDSSKLSNNDKINKVESLQARGIARVQTAAPKGIHLNPLNDSYITGNKFFKKIASGYDNIASNISGRLNNAYDSAFDSASDWLTKHNKTKLAKGVDWIHDIPTNIINNDVARQSIAGLTTAVGIGMTAGGAETPIVMSNQAIAAKNQDPTLYDDYQKFSETTKQQNDIYGSDLLEGVTNNGQDSTNNDLEETNNSSQTSSDNNNNNNKNNSTTQNRENYSSSGSSSSSGTSSNNNNSSSTEDKSENKEDNKSDEKENIDTKEEDKNDLLEENKETDEKEDSEKDEEAKEDTEKENNKDEETSKEEQEQQNTPQDNNPQQTPGQEDTVTQPEDQQQQTTTQPEQQTPSYSNPSYTTPSYTTPSYSSPSISTTTTPGTSDTTTNSEDLEVLDDDLDESLDDLVEGGLLEDSEITEDTETDEDLYTIPTPTEPTETTTEDDGGSGIGPILTGLGLAGAAGVGAKIFLDKKKESELGSEDEEEDEIVADEWNEDNDSFDFMNGEDSPFNYQDQDQEAQ